MYRKLLFLFWFFKGIFLSTSPPIIKCGCLISVDGLNGYMTADCSKRPVVDYVCLAKQQPEYLDLSWKKLHKVPDALKLSGFKNVKHLDLSGNNLTRLVSYNIGSMNQLNHLNLSDNYLTDVPNDRPPPKLVLDLSRNKLTDMHSLFGLIYNDATVLGNPILCNCTSPHVKRMYNQASKKHIITFECILHDEDIPKPISTQCHDLIDKAETSSPSLDGIIVLIILFILGSLGLIVACCKKNR